MISLHDQRCIMGERNDGRSIYRCDLVSQYLLLMIPFRAMLLTPQSGLSSLGPTAHWVPVYPMV